MRIAIPEMILEDPTLQALGVDTVLTGDVDTPMGRLFINLRWGQSIPGVWDSNRHSLVIWVHDEPNDYSRIVKILKRLRVMFREYEGGRTTFDSGAYISAIDWVSESSDLIDEGHGTITRQTTFEIIGSEGG